MLIAGLSFLTTYFSKNLNVDNHRTVSFAESTRIRVDEAAILESLGGIYPVCFWSKSENERQIISPGSVSAKNKI